MTPQETARELINKFRRITDEKGLRAIKLEYAKQCALIAVDFAMNSKYSFQPMHGGLVSGKLYYEEIKQEIEKL